MDPGFMEPPFGPVGSMEHLHGPSLWTQLMDSLFSYQKQRCNEACNSHLLKFWQKKKYFTVKTGRKATPFTLKFTSNFLSPV